MSQARILEYANMRQGRPRGDLEQVRRRKRSGTRRKRGTEGERGSTSQERPRQTDQAGVEAHICPAHDRHSQDPPVVERTTHARAIRHAATRHGTRAAFPTGLMSEHPAVFHGLLAAWQLAHAERDERVHAHLVIVADATPQLCHAAELHTSETTANDIWIQARPSSAAFNQHRTAGAKFTTNPSRASSQSSTAQSRDRGRSRHSAPSTALTVATGASRTLAAPNSNRPRASRSSLEASRLLSQSEVQSDTARVEKKKTVARVAPEKTSGMPQRRPTRARAHRDERGLEPHIFFLYFAF